jgi:hypothetical protein
LVSNTLTSWKEIATYLGKSVRTVQRWEATLGLPVRRPNANDRNIVVALPAELDEWIKKRLQPRKVASQQHCADQLQRMHKLMHVMLQETQRTVEKTAELVRKFDRNGRRKSIAVGIAADERHGGLQEDSSLQNVN